MEKFKDVITKSKVLVNSYGVHIDVFFKHGIPSENADEPAKEGEEIAKITYHVTTNSVSIGSIKDDSYTADEIILYFVGLLKTPFAEYIKEQANMTKLSNQPIWCKQTGKHYC